MNAIRCTVWSVPPIHSIISPMRRVPRWRAMTALALVCGVTLASDGTRLWSRIWGSTDHDEPWALAVDTGGCIYVGGRTTGAFDGQTNVNWYDIFLSKFTPEGTKEWSRIWGAGANDEAIGAAGDADGNVYVAGTASGNFDGQTTYVLYTDFFLSKVAPDGSRPWSRIWGSSAHDTGGGVSVTPQGDVYVSGCTEGALAGQSNAGFQDVCLTKFTSAGDRSWVRMFGTPSRDFGTACAADSQGNVYITGFTEGFLHGNTNMGGQDIFLVKYDGDGTRQWSVVWGTNGTDRGSAVAVDQQDDIYVAGTTDGMLDGQPKPGGNDIWLSKFRADGTKLWTRMIGSASDETCGGVCIDNEHNVYVTGRTLGAFDGQTNTQLGAYDCCIAKFAPNGTRLWTRIWGSRYSDGCLAAAAYRSNAVYVAAFTYGAFDGQTNTAPTYEDAVLSRFGYGAGGTLMVSSENPSSAVPIAVARPDDAGLSNGLTPFARTYGAAWETSLTAPPAAQNRRFDRWRLNDLEAGTNHTLTLVMSTSLTAHAIYISDDFQAAWPLAGAQGSVSAVNTRATYEPGEPAHRVFYGPYRSLWWSYAPSTHGVLYLNTHGSAFDTALAVYTGAGVSNLTRVAANDNDGSPGGASALMVTNARAGTTYYIAVDGAASWDYGQCLLTWNFTPNSPHDGAVVINELMINPQAVADADGEWIELRNTSTAAVDCTGWRLSGGASAAMTLPPLTVPPQGFATFCRNTDSGANGGVSGGLSYGGMNLLNGGDVLWLYDAQTQLVDVVMWQTAVAGRSLELIDPWADNFSSGTNWAAASSAFGLGDYGTPGAENSMFIPEPTALLSALLGLWLARSPRVVSRAGVRPRR
jgi:hypothetical protein